MPAKGTAVLVLLAALGAVAWLLFDGAQPGPAPDPGEPRNGPEGRPGEAPPPPPAPTATVPGPPPAVPEAHDPGWITTPLRLPAGSGPLRGSDLVAAVEAAGTIRLVGATPEDERLLAEARLDVPRDQEAVHASLLGWLEDAGFVVREEFPRLIVRRRTPEDPPR